MDPYRRQLRRWWPRTGRSDRYPVPATGGQPDRPLRMITQHVEDFGQWSYPSQCDRRLDALGTPPCYPQLLGVLSISASGDDQVRGRRPDPIATHEPSTAARGHAGGPARVGRLRGAGSTAALVTACRARMAGAVTWGGGELGGFP